MNCRTPSEATYIPPSSLQFTDISDYKEAIILALSLSSARSNAAKSIHSKHSTITKDNMTIKG